MLLSRQSVCKNTWPIAPVNYSSVLKSCFALKMSINRKFVDRVIEAVILNLNVTPNLRQSTGKSDKLQVTIDWLINHRDTNLNTHRQINFKKLN